LFVLCFWSGCFGAILCFALLAWMDTK
jgi:hypothetical protein